MEVISIITNPITSLSLKGKKFEWIEKCYEAFIKLKCLLTNAPILRVLKIGKDCALYGCLLRGFRHNDDVRHWCNRLC